MRLGPWEIALILIIIMIVFGLGKLPEVGRQLGQRHPRLQEVLAGGR